MLRASEPGGCPAASKAAARRPAFGPAARCGAGPEARRSPRRHFPARARCSGWAPRKPPGTRPEPAQPLPGLRQRNLHVPAAAFALLAPQRRRRAHRDQVAGRLVEDLHRQGPRLAVAGRLALGVVEAHGGLHQRIEAAPLRPGALRAVGRERDVDDAGAPLAPSARARSPARPGRRADSPARTHAHRPAVPRQRLAPGLAAQVDDAPRACRGWCRRWLRCSADAVR